MSDADGLQALGRRHGVRLGEPIMRSLDRSLAEMQAKVEEYIEESRRWRNRAQALEREMLDRLGPCVSGAHCRLHAGHYGSCAMS